MGGANRRRRRPRKVASAHRKPAKKAKETERLLAKAARSSGVNIDSLRAWAEEKRKELSKRDSTHLIYGVLRDLERSEENKGVRKSRP